MCLLVKHKRQLKRNSRKRTDQHREEKKKKKQIKLVNFIILFNFKHASEEDILFVEFII